MPAVQCCCGTFGLLQPRRSAGLRSTRPGQLQGRLQRALRQHRLRVPIELASMRSAAQSKATDLNEAEIAHFMTKVRSWAARIARTHARRRALLSLKRQLRYGALETGVRMLARDGA